MAVVNFSFSRGLRGLVVWALACAASLSLAQAQALRGVALAQQRAEIQDPVVLEIKLDRAGPGCGVLLSDGTGGEYRVVLRDPVTPFSLNYARDGRFEVQLQGKPTFEGYALYWACEGQLKASVLVESNATRRQRLAAEAAAKKRAQEQAVAQAKADEQRRADEAKARELAQVQEVERQKAAMEAAARQRAADEAARQRAAHEAAVAKAREELQRAREANVLNRLKKMLSFGGSSNTTVADSASKSAAKMSCQFQSEKNIDDKEKQCLYTCEDGSLEGRTRNREVDCPQFINSANS